VIPAGTPPGRRGNANHDRYRRSVGPNSRDRLRRRGVVPAVLAAVAALVLSGCSADTLQRGYLPEASTGATDQTQRVTDLWNGSWVAALAVGVLVWGLTIWVVIAYRRRRSDDPAPRQIRYHVPLEITYTVVPLVMVSVLFYFTARDQAAILSMDDADGGAAQHTVEVIGKQWSWDFNYVEEDVYVTGRQAQLQAPGVEDRLPQLWLPVNERVEFHLYARDVNHSFFVPAWLFKMDNIPGRENQFRVTPTREGTFAGRCAELCGENHAEMLFTVRVVSREEFDAHIAELEAAGQTGQLSVELSREGLVPGYVGGGVTGRGNEGGGN